MEREIKFTKATYQTTQRNSTFVCQCRVDTLVLAIFYFSDSPSFLTADPFCLQKNTVVSIHKKDWEQTSKQGRKKLYKGRTAKEVEKKRNKDRKREINKRRVRMEYRCIKEEGKIMWYEEYTNWKAMDLFVVKLTRKWSWTAQRHLRFICILI